MRACAVATMTAGCRSRSWNKYELKKLQRVANYCVRRAFGMDIWNMREHHVSDAMMHKVSQWPTMEETIMKLSMQYGLVMPCSLNIIINL